MKAILALKTNKAAENDQLIDEMLNACPLTSVKIRQPILPQIWDEEYVDVFGVDFYVF